MVDMGEGMSFNRPLFCERQAMEDIGVKEQVEREALRDGTMESVFMQAIRFELRVEQFYLELAAGSAAYPPAAELWAKMAADERHHACELKRLLEGLSAEQREEPAERDLAERVGQVHRQADRLSLDSVVTLYDAYQLAHEMESGELNYLFRLLIRKFIPSGDRCRLLTEEVTMHQQRLSEFAGRFGNRREMRQILLSGKGGRDGNTG